MKDSTQVLAELVADLKAAVANCEQKIQPLLAHDALSTGGRVLGMITADPFCVTVSRVLASNGYGDIDDLDNKLSPAIDKLMVTWGKQAHDTFPGTLQANNAWLVIALGPDAPQFVDQGNGTWALVEVSRT